MDVYLAQFCLNKNNDCFETIGVYETDKGALDSIKKHQDYVYDNADVFFKEDSQTNLCVWDTKKMKLNK